MAYRYPTVKIAGRTKLRHRHVAEQKLGRTLSPDEHVHHRNKDPFDPSPDNLEVLDGATHRQLHADLRLKYPREKACSVCGAPFVPHPTKRKRQVTCSKICANVQRSRSEKATKSRPPATTAPAPRLQPADRRRMTQRCLHCDIWQAIRAHAIAEQSILEGKAICDRGGTAIALSNVLAEVLHSIEGQHERLTFVGKLVDELLAIAEMPAPEQPWLDVELVEWQ